MSQEHEHHEHDGQEAHAEHRPAAQQQPQDAPSDGHAGQGSESAMRQMRVWEEHRASNSGGKGRGGPA